MDQDNNADIDVPGDNPNIMNNNADHMDHDNIIANDAPNDVSDSNNNSFAKDISDDDDVLSSLTKTRKSPNEPKNQKSAKKHKSGKARKQNSAKKSKNMKPSKSHDEHIKELSAYDGQLLDILDRANAKTKVTEKRNSATRHFNFYLALRNAKLIELKQEVGPISYADLTFADIDKGPYIGGFAGYVANSARLYTKSSNPLISYGTASGYMGSIKNELLDRFHRAGVGIPSTLQNEVWKRMMNRVRSIKWEQCRNDRKSMFGSKESASEADRMSLIIICIWSGTTTNAEFLNFFPEHGDELWQGK